MYFQCEIMDPNLAGGHVIAGYQTVRKVTDIEMNVLKVRIKNILSKRLILIFGKLKPI